MQSINKVLFYDSDDKYWIFKRGISYIRHNIVELLAAIALVFISQTRLRFVGVPFGIGELVLMLLPCIALLKVIRTIKADPIYLRQFINISCSNYLKFFPLVFLLCSAFSAYWIGEHNPMLNLHYLLHNVLAYSFVGMFFLSLFYLDVDFVLLGFMFSISLFACLCIELLVLPGYQLFYYGLRFTGLADNPNQLAISILPTFFFILLYAKKTELNKNYAVSFCFLPLFFAYITHSSALILAYIFAIVYLFIFFETSQPFLKKYRGLVILMSVIFLSFLTVQDFYKGMRVKHIIQSSYTETVKGAEEGFHSLTTAPPLEVGAGASRSNLDHLLWHLHSGVMSKQDINPAFSPIFSAASLRGSLNKREGTNTEEFAIRLRLWLKALSMMSAHPLLGYGAGACIAIEVEAGQLCEVHNTLIDVIYQSGLIGGVALVIFLYMILREINNFPQDKTLYIGLFISIVVFSIFHLIIRHPIVWFSFAYILAKSFPHLSKRNCASLQC